VCGSAVEEVKVGGPQADQLPVPDSNPGLSARFCALPEITPSSSNKALNCQGIADEMKRWGRADEMVFMAQLPDTSVVLASDILDQLMGLVEEKSM